MNTRNKKAQISATLTWVAAFIIIFFIMVIFLVLAMGVGAKKSLPVWFEYPYYKGAEAAELNFNSIAQDAFLTKSIVGFLQTPVEVDKQKLTISELAVQSKANIGYKDIAENELKVFFEKFGLPNKLYENTLNVLYNQLRK